MKAFLLLTSLCAVFAIRAPVKLGLDPKEWMKQGIDKIGPKTLQNITLPGTHNSGTIDLTEFPIEGQAETLWPAIDVVIKPFHLNKEKEMIKWSTCQEYSITDQLEEGIRYFDFMVVWNSTEKSWFVYNNLRGQPVVPMLAEIAKYLKSYDKEIVIVELSHFTGKPSTANITSLKTSVTTTFGSLLYPVTTNLAFTVNDMIKADKRAIVTMESGYDAQTIWPPKTIYTSIPDVDKEAALVEAFGPIVETYNNKTWPDILYKMSWVLTPTYDTILKTLLFYEPHSVADLADKANKHLPKFWEKYEKTAYWRMGNILVIDFNKKSDIFDVVMKMNGIS